MIIKTPFVIALILSFVLVSAAESAPITRLHCQGTITDQLDLKQKEIEKKSLNVLIDHEKRTIEISESWSCIADMGNTSSPHLRQACIGKLPLQITPDEFIFFGQSSDAFYSGSTTLKINRYSGTMNISGISQAKPAARARWSLWIVDGQLACSTPTKKF
jgi:hypothetical protein